MGKIGKCTVVCCSAIGFLFSGAGHGQSTYPNKAIMVQIALQAGTGSDVAVRGMLGKVEAALGQSFIIENSPGAAGLIAAQKVLKAAPNGYQLVALNNGTVTILPHINPNIRFDPLKDLVPIAVITAIPSVLFVHPSVPAKSVGELIEIARKNPGKLTYISGGIGSPQHLAMEALKATSNINLLHVPYKGSGQARLDLVAGRVDSGFQGISGVLEYAKTNRVRLLAWAGAQRYPLFPDLPTMHESGVTGFLYEPWTALFAPAGTPKEVVAKINAEIRKVARQPEFRKSWAALGLEPKDFSVERTEAVVRDEFARNGRIVRASNIKAD